MKHYKYILILLMTMCLSVSAAQETINIKLSDIDENGNVTLTLNIEQAPVVVEPEPEEPPVIPEEPEQPPTVEPGDIRPQVIYDEDLAVNSPQSTVSNPVFPRGFSELFDITYDGSYRAFARGESSSNYTTGTLALNNQNKSIYMAGYRDEGSIAEFLIPSEFIINNDVSKIKGAEVIQEYVRVLGNTSNNAITGMGIINGGLWVNSEIQYDAGGKNDKALQVLNPNNIKNSDISKIYRVEGDAKIAGWIGQIPEDAQSLFGDHDLFMGNAANYSINTRYSHGPSFATFNKESLKEIILKTNQRMVFPYSDDGSTHITPTADDVRNDNPSPLWNVLTKAKYGFIPKDSKILVILGTNAGYHTKIIYKDDDRYPDFDCEGSCPISDDDASNFYWLFDLHAIAQAEQPHLIQPFNYGKWSHPHDNGSPNLGGGAFDIETGQLHVTLKGAGKTGKYGFPPMINVYTIKFKVAN